MTHSPPESDSQPVNFGFGTFCAASLAPIAVSNENRIQIERLVLQITEYLARNPMAADTLAGIQSWWLSGAMRNVHSTHVKTAVRLLVQRRTLQCNIQPDGTKTYSRANSGISAQRSDHVGG